MATRYDPAADATLLGARVCSHAPCGPLVWVRGDWRAGIHQPRLLRTDAAALTLANAEPSGEGRYGQTHVAIEQTFEAASPWPVVLGHVALRVGALLLLSFPLPVPFIRRAAVTLGPILGVAFALSTANMGLAVIGCFMLALAAGVIGAIVLIAYLVTSRRVRPQALGVLLFATAFILTLPIVDAYFPSMGWGD